MYYMTQLRSFLGEYAGEIMMVVILILGLLVLFSMLGVDFNPRNNEHIDKVVTIESFINEVDQDDSIDKSAPPTSDDSEETGRPVNVSYDSSEADKQHHKQERERHVAAGIQHQHQAIHTALLDSMNPSSICNPKNSTLAEAHKTCSTITRANTCDLNSCCIRLGTGKCVGGDSKGPTYLAHGGQKVDADYYYYKAKCYGKCPGT